MQYASFAIVEIFHFYR